MKSVKKIAAFLVAIVTVTCIVGCSGTAKSEQAKSDQSVSEQAKSEQSEIEQVRSESADSWPTTKLAKLIEQPDFGVLEVELDTADVLMLDFRNVEKSDYNAYVESCMEAFSVDYYKSTTFFSAENEKGYAITISYYDDDKGSMNVTIYAPVEEDEVDSEENSKDVTTEEEFVDDVAKEEEALDDATEVNVAEEEAQETEDNSSKDADDSSTGINPDLKELLDSYEDFVDEYCEFMKKYYKADATEMLDLLVDYTEYCAKLNDLQEKIDKYDESTMTAAEAQYYSEVILRCSDKMLNVIQ